MYKRIWRNEKYRLRNDGETSNDGDASTPTIWNISISSLGLIRDILAHNIAIKRY